MKASRRSAMKREAATVSLDWYCNSVQEHQIKNIARMNEPKYNEFGIITKDEIIESVVAFKKWYIENGYASDSYVENFTNAYAYHLGLMFEAAEQNQR